MKLSTRLLCLVIALGATPAIAQLPALPVQHSLMLDVENRAAGGGAKDANAPMVGAPASNSTVSASAVTQTRTHSTTLQVTVRNLGRVPDNVQLEWYFFAKPAGKGQKDFLFDSGSQALAVQANAETSVNVTSKAAQSSTVTTVSASSTGNSITGNSVSYSSSDRQEGNKLSGWVVRLVADGKVLEVRGSEFKYEDMAKDPNGLKPGK